MCSCHWGDLLPFSIAQVVMIMILMFIIIIIMMDDGDDNDGYNGDLLSFRLAQVDKVAMKG